MVLFIKNALSTLDWVSNLNLPSTRYRVSCEINVLEQASSRRGFYCRSAQMTTHRCRLFQTSGTLLHELQIISAQLTDQQLKEEVSLLIEAIAASPTVINLGGFITINRELLTTMFSILVSHLVILLQFHYSFLDTTKTNPLTFSLSPNTSNFSSEDYSTSMDYTRD
uniref:Uncharacterized protein n=1 Tax=Timema cristinae TaxID=61476 RepID=A0A7R9D1S8_TIMCR|nr:unnamed protein product [Timema cristinae]